MLAHLSEPIPIRFDIDYSDHMNLIRAELVNGLMPKLEAQIIGGNGSGENLTGILNTSGIQAPAYTNDLPTTIRKARTALQTLDETPTAWVFHPADAEALDLLREGTGTGQLLELARVLGDLPFVVSNGVPVGTACWRIGTSAGCTSTEDSTFAVDAGGDHLSKNEFVMRVEGRYGFAVLRPQAFVKVDLTA